jgi:hypothetical protein
MGGVGNRPAGRPPGRAAAWALSLGASFWIHVAAYSVLSSAYFAWFLAFDGENPFALRYRNPYRNGSPDGPDSVRPVELFIAPPRPRRELPELESWENKKVTFEASGMPFREVLARPLWVDTASRVHAAPASGMAIGESLDYVSDKPFKGKGTYDNPGPDSGGGGRYGAAAPWMDPVHLALLWLARHQGPDGAWGRPPRCTCPAEPGPEDPIRATGLALLAFFGAGYGPESNVHWDGYRYGSVVGQGLRWMAGQQAADGRLGPPGVEPLSHAVGALALVEACRRSDAADYAYEAERAADRAARQAQASGRPTDPVFWPAGWTALAVTAADRAGLDVHPVWLRAGRAWLVQAADLVPASDEDAHRTYFALQASDPNPFEAKVRSVLRERQDRRESSCRRGSWDPGGHGGGRAVVTALFTLTLEAGSPYGYRYGRGAGR